MNIVWDFIHVKGIPIEHWDEAEIEEYCELMDKKIAKWESKQAEIEQRNEEFSRKPKLSDPDSDQ